MPMQLEGSCRCGAVKFSVDSHTPQPYQRCYCSICRKTAGGGGYAITLMGVNASLSVHGNEALCVYHAEICDDDGSNCKISTGQRHFCGSCASALWMFHPEWPDFIYPFASAIDTNLPTPLSCVHTMLRYKANWVDPVIGRQDQCFDKFPKQSVEEWHRQRGLWIE